MVEKMIIKAAIAASISAVAATGVAAQPTPADHTQDSSASASSPSPPPAAPAPKNTAGSSLAGSDAEAQKFARFDALAEPGLNTTLPGSGDSLTRDMGGYRTWLADHDIGIQSRITNLFWYNPLETGQPRSPQHYNGQRVTVGQTGVSVLTIGLDSIGLDNAKLIVAGNYLVNTYEPNGPNTVTLKTLAYYQSFFNKKVEVKVGFQTNYYSFIGLFTGGSPVLSSGISGLIPIQAGLSADPANTPSLNITLNGKKGLYLASGFQRSTSPHGTAYEVRHNNFGLKFAQRDAKLLTIGEVGLRRSSAPGTHQMWLRAGYMHNSSEYTRFDNGGTSGNEVFYVLGDRQITQPSGSLPFRGIYVGASAFFAPKDVNISTKNFELRAYSIGALASRPKDALAVRVSYTKYSSDAQDSYGLQGLHTNGHQISANVSYSAHLRDGIYVTPSIAYIKNPSFVGDFKDALVLNGTIYLII